MSEKELWRKWTRLPDGENIKKLKGHDDLFRLRASRNYRIIYIRWKSRYSDRFCHLMPGIAERYITDIKIAGRDPRLFALQSVDENDFECPIEPVNCAGIRQEPGRKLLDISVD